MLRPVRLPGGVAACGSRGGWPARGSTRRWRRRGHAARAAGEVTRRPWRQVGELARTGVASPLHHHHGPALDAVAAICGLRAEVHYEGQAATSSRPAAIPTSRVIRVCHARFGDGTHGRLWPRSPASSSRAWRSRWWQPPSTTRGRVTARACVSPRNGARPRRGALRRRVPEPPAAGAHSELLGAAGLRCWCPSGCAQRRRDRLRPARGGRRAAGRGGGGVSDPADAAVHPGRARFRGPARTNPSESSPLRTSRPALRAARRVPDGADGEVSLGRDGVGHARPLDGRAGAESVGDVDPRRSWSERRSCGVVPPGGSLL